ncbi:unnamed protein product [Allacma fusca]|uniref:ELMO domain-containing protein n=1 Tax=Allacma fusca TaxID=39272 RepID=A0A8J2P3Z6_9HEXA|nr:unnamed protein product [Allacma fusca]
MGKEDKTKLDKYTRVVGPLTYHFLKLLSVTNVTTCIHCPGLSAREKKLIASVDLSSNERNGGPVLWNEDELEWRAPSTEILNLKQSINYECSNSIPINFTEAWSYFHSSDMSQYYERADRESKQTAHTVSKIRSTISELVGHPALKSALCPERNLILAIASCPMNNDCTVHRRILQSIYVFMTKNPSCTRYGSHWEEVGFQGQDPASDLRGVGMFGALQMLYLSSSQETKETLAPEVYDLSRHPIHQFPLAVLSLNVTKMTLDAFRDGLLNRFCNKEDSAIIVVNRFYLAIMYRIYKKWSEKGMTIHDSCYLLKAVEKWCRANPKKTFMKMNEYLGRNDGTNNKKRTRKTKKSDRGADSSNTPNSSCFCSLHWFRIGNNEDFAS